MDLVKRREELITGQTGLRTLGIAVLRAAVPETHGSNRRQIFLVKPENFIELRKINAFERRRVDARPRSKGMERADLLNANAEIFVAQGRALNEAASRDCKVLVVGNPCNTNAWIAMKSAPDLKPENFTSMLRLDQNRLMAQTATQAKVSVNDITHAAVWGNHSPAMFPDLDHALIKGRPALELVDRSYYQETMTPIVAKRGSAIIEARGASSAASAASAAIDHIRDWVLGSGDRWVTMGVPSDGSYGIPEGLLFGFPCTTKDGRWEIVQGLELSDFARATIAKSVAELESERAHVAALLG